MKLGKRLTIVEKEFVIDGELDDIRKRLINQNTNKEFLFMNIATHMPFTDFHYYTHKEDVSNLMQLLVAYILVAIPATYMQLLLGQYTRLGFFFIDKMIPLARGISYMTSLYIIFISVTSSLYLETMFIYALISLRPAGIPWIKCNEMYKDRCWEIGTDCSTKCLKEDHVFLAAYLYWNITYMSQTLPIEKARIALPDITRLWASLLTWVVIYLLTIINIVKLKKVCKIVITVQVIVKCLVTTLFLLKDGLNHTFTRAITAAVSSSFSFYAWVAAIRRAVHTVGVGDLSNIMFGILSKDVNRGGTMSFVNGMIMFLIETLDFFLLETTSISLKTRSGIEHQHLIFSPITADMNTGLIPSLLGILNAGPLWAFIFFFCKYISALLRVIMAIRLLQNAAYQRYPKLFDYYKYVSPTICGTCFFLHCCLQSKEAYEIYQDLRHTTETLFGLIIGFMLSTFVVYVYGLKRFSEDIHFMTGQPPTKLCKITWYLLPILLLVPMPFNYLSYKHPLYGYRIGFLIIFVIPYLIPSAIEIFVKIKLRSLYAVIQPNMLWGPITVKMRARRALFNPNNATRFQGAMYSCRHKCLIYNRSLYTMAVDEILAQEVRENEETEESNSPPVV